jgi:nitric oxide reductase large subunit
MRFLHLVSIFLWIAMIYISARLFFGIKGKGFKQSEIITMNILLLSGLNICIPLISLATLKYEEPLHTLMSYFVVGSSMFQLLLCHFITRYIKNKRGTQK